MCSLLKGNECESKNLTHLCHVQGHFHFMSLLSSVQTIPGNSFNSGSQLQTVITVGAKLPGTHMVVYRYKVQCVLLHNGYKSVNKHTHKRDNTHIKKEN